MRLLWVLVLNGLFVSSAVADDLLVVPVGDLFVDQPVAFEVSGAAAGERLELKVKRANGKMKAFGQMTADESGEAVFHGVLPKGYSHGDTVRVKSRSLESAAVSAVERFPIARLVDSAGVCVLAYDDGYKDGEDAHADDYGDGYTGGYDDGFVAGEAAHVDDYSDGYTEGYDAADAACLFEDLDQDTYDDASYTAGETAHANDYSDGYDDGYIIGYDAADTACLFEDLDQDTYDDASYTAGETAHANDYSDGYDDGYIIGYDAADAACLFEDLDQDTYDDASYTAGVTAGTPVCEWAYEVFDGAACVWGSPTDLSGVDLRNADLVGVDLSGVDLTGADLRGVDLTGAVVTGDTIWTDVNFNANTVCTDGEPSIEGKDQSGSTAYTCFAPGMDLSGTGGGELTGDACLNNNDCTGNEECQGGDSLAGVYGYCEEPGWVFTNDAVLSTCTYWDTYLGHMDPCGFDYERAVPADLSQMDLRRVRFTTNGRKLWGVSFVGADLTDASLQSAQAQNADFTGANLTNANLLSVQWDDAICPDGQPAGNDDDCCDQLDIDIDGDSLIDTVDAKSGC
jgi:uncharacterized protein YjbI with pentapeptide repeats